MGKFQMFNLSAMKDKVNSCISELQKIKSGVIYQEKPYHVRYTYKQKNAKIKVARFITDDSFSEKEKLTKMANACYLNKNVPFLVEKGATFFRTKCFLCD